MIPRPSLRTPITLAVLIIIIVLVLAAGYVVLAVRGIVSHTSPGVYWTLLSVGATLFVLVVVGIVLYLMLSIKAINVTRRQSNFIDSVTHELKSPIASLKLYLQTLSRRTVNAEEQAEFYRCMLDDVERLDGLINHMLAAARLERAAADDKKHPVAVDSLLHDCARAVCLRYRVPLETVALDVEPCVVMGKRVDLEQIFQNLIDNAVKYADGQSPMVEVHSRFDARHRRAIVSISDNGPGIPPHLQRKIFGRFVRLGTELERVKPGTGLGLHIVRTLIDRWKGQIRVVQRDGKQGATFEVTLPDAAAATPTAVSRSDVNETVSRMVLGQE